mgnify:CR=1 FL=1
MKHGIRAIVLTLSTFPSLYSGFGAISEVAGGHRVLPILAPATLYVSYPVSSDRNLTLENHLINTVVFAIPPVWIWIWLSLERQRTPITTTQAFVEKPAGGTVELGATEDTNNDRKPASSRSPGRGPDLRREQQ